MSKAISQLSAAGALSDADLFAIVQSSTTLKITWASLIAAIRTVTDETTVTASKYTATPPSVGQINFSDTSDMLVGQPIKIVQGASTFYHVVASISTNSNITVYGPVLSTVTAIDSIDILSQHRVVQVDFLCPGNYAASGATATLILDTTNSRFQWHNAAAYLVHAAFSHNTPDTNTVNQPTVNILVAGSDGFGTDVTLPNATTFTPVAVGNATAANYEIAYGESIEIDLASTPGNQDAKDLTASLTFILD